MRATRRSYHFLAMLLLFGVSACLTSEPPTLKREDLVQPDGLAGVYFLALSNAANKQRASMEVEIKPGADGDYSVVPLTNGQPDKPMGLRLLSFKPDVYIGVLSNTAAETPIAMYAFVTLAPDQHWSVKLIDLAKDARTPALLTVAKRHGVANISFQKGMGGTNDDTMSGALNAEQLRGLLGDPDFAAAIQTEIEMELTAKPD